MGRKNKAFSQPYWENKISKERVLLNYNFLIFKILRTKLFLIFYENTKQITWPLPILKIFSKTKLRGSSKLRHPKIQVKWSCFVRVLIPITRRKDSLAESMFYHFIYIPILIGDGYKRFQVSLNFYLKTENTHIHDENFHKMQFSKPKSILLFRIYRPWGEGGWVC